MNHSAKEGWKLEVKGNKRLKLKKGVGNIGSLYKIGSLGPLCHQCFQLIEFKCLNPVQSFQKDSLLSTTESLGVPGTLLIDQTMRLPIGFESEIPEFIIDKKLINHSFFITKQYTKC